MFLRNKYRDIYLRLVNTRRNRARIDGVYYESHHIIPRSLRPEYDKCKWNRVDLTAREHFIAHLLLVRITEGEERNKMVCALYYMYNKQTYVKTSRHYQYIRVLYNKSVTGKKFTEEQRQAMRDGWAKSEKRFGRKISAEHQELLRQSRIVTVELINPDGEHITISNITEFCKLNGLNQAAISNVIRGQRRSHKGYTIPNVRPRASSRMKNNTHLPLTRPVDRTGKT